MVFVFGALLFAAPSFAEAALGERTLSKGASGEDVAQLQEYLLTKGVYPYHTATGYFGPITEQAVIDFQQNQNLKVDGIAGPQTNHAVQVLKQGDIGRPVAVLQSQLKNAGYYQSSVDGIYGSGTASAVKSFQQAAGLVVDGIAGPNTREALDQRAARQSTAAGKELIVESTAYTADCSGCSGVTKMGVDLKKYPDAKVIAVDPSVIPLGSIVHVEGYGYAIAADTGGAIGGSKIDVFIPNLDDAYQWGRKEVHIKVIK